MPGLRLFTSNRLEILADSIADVLQTPPDSPLLPEIIVVQSLGMKHWLSLEIAKRMGICANYKFLFPNHIIQEIFNNITGYILDERLFDKEIISWKIMNVLPGCSGKKGFESIDNYLAGSNPLKLYQLSSIISDIFDQYLTYRPDFILNWDSGKENHWQAELWRMLTCDMKGKHPPGLRKNLYERLERPDVMDTAMLPERISVFGISALPVFHMDVLDAVSRLIEVNIFLMNPSEKFWGHIKADMTILKTLRRDEKVSASDMHFEKGNSLLASMGGTGRDFLNIIMNYEPEDYSLFLKPECDSLLHCIQYDILNMTDRGMQDEDEAGIIRFSADRIKADRSVTIHSCHSPMREAEILHDYLLDLFNSSDIDPHDILVMTPDIETYSPYISSVFGAQSDEKLRIPFSIADRSEAADSRIAEAFFMILDLAGSRFPAGSVADILETEGIYLKFGLAYHDIELIRRWISETRICWGIDADDRAGLGMPGFKENTWQWGIDRMLMGYAAGGDEESLFNGILPYGGIEGSDYNILGRFIGFFNELTACVNTLKGKNNLPGWSEKLNSMLNRLFLPGNDNDYSAIEYAVNRLNFLQERSGFQDEIEFPVIKSYLKDAVGSKISKGGFLNGCVTFCAMLPMRSIPFKIICMIGMNDGAFPVSKKTAGFDLIAKDPRQGDRSPRNDDRYLFLESLISAREKLYISYVGQSIQDNSEIPPAVPVSELIDYIEQGYGINCGNIRDHILIKHRLQGFSPWYYNKDSAFYSYSVQNFNACRTAVKERRDITPFFSGSLPEPGEEGKTIYVQDMIRFFQNPARYLLTQRLGIYLKDENNIIEEREPFELAGLDKYQAGDEIIRRILQDRSGSIYDLIKAKGILPYGNAGEIVYNNLARGSDDFAKIVMSRMKGDKLEPHIVDLDIAGHRLTGAVGDIWPGGMINFHYAKAKARYRVIAWINHLLLNASPGNSGNINSYLLCSDKSWETGAVKEPGAILEELVNIYLKGRNEFVRFYPESSFGYISRLQKDKSHDSAVYEASKIWKGSNYVPGEVQDNYLKKCTNGLDPFEKPFAEISKKIFEPLLFHQKEIIL